MIKGKKDIILISKAIQAINQELEEKIIIILLKRAQKGTVKFNK